MIFLSLVLYGKAENPPSDKDKAVACIKRWEGWHRGKMPYIGYGHRRNRCKAFSPGASLPTA